MNDPLENYEVEVGAYYGDAGDAFSLSSERPFSTRGTGSSNCSNSVLGTWWYGSSCSHINLNGPYLQKTEKLSKW